jgi:virginiamycin B lyase
VIGGGRAAPVRTRPRRHALRAGTILTLVVALSCATALAARVQTFAHGIPSEAYPTGLASHGGAVFFAEPGAEEIGRVTPDGVVSQIAAPGGPTWLTFGPDGALWYSATDDGAIGRIGRGHAVTEFTAGMPAASEPAQIVSGPGGALWFADDGTDAIGRITPTGKVTEYPLAPGSGPLGIAAAPGGLWFTESRRGAVGFITPAGAVTHLLSLGRHSAPAGIAYGPGTTLWVAESAADLVAEVQLTGTFVNARGKVVTAPAVVRTVFFPPFAGPFGVAVGHDGNVWVTELDGGRIARISGTGALTEFGPRGDVTGVGTGVPAHALAGPEGIVAGPGGALWFTLHDGGAIGRIFPPAPCRIPRLIGDTLSRARQVLQSSGCLLGQIHNVAPPAGHKPPRNAVVVGQPKRGTVLPGQSLVNITAD